MATTCEDGIGENLISGWVQKLEQSHLDKVTVSLQSTTGFVSSKELFHRHYVR
jgi:hypothetical protein